jgi:hypothetical protein
MINTLKMRFYLFLFGCIGSRLGFTLLSYLVSGKLLTLLGILALVPVIGWFYIIFIGERDTGLEVFGDKIWWKSLRPIHMLLWLFFAYLAILQNPYAWIILLVDTIFGLTSFLLHHWSQGNLKIMLSYK